MFKGESALALPWVLRALAFLVDTIEIVFSAVLSFANGWAPKPGPVMPLPLGFNDWLIRRPHEYLFLVWLEIVWILVERRAWS